MKALHKLGRGVKAFLLQQHLVVGLITATLIGALWPAPGQAANKIEPIKVSQVAVVLIFFIQGLKLKTEDTVKALRRPWPLLLGLASILLVTPVLGFGMAQLRDRLQYPEFSTGLTMFTLAPTTSSAAVIVVGIVEGNVALALLLTAIANLFAVFTVPFSLRWTLSSTDGHIDSISLLWKLVLTIFAPCVLGKLCVTFIRPLRTLTHVYALQLRILMTVIFSFIPWTEVSKAGDQLRTVSPASVFTLIALGSSIHCGLLLFNYPLSFLIPMDTYDRKAFVITCSQKALSFTASVLLFLPQSTGNHGLIILPAVMAHILQVAIDSVLAVMWKNRTSDELGASPASPSEEPEHNGEDKRPPETQLEVPAPNACDPGAPGGADDAVVVIDMDGRAAVAVSTVQVTTGGTPAT